MSKKEKCEVCGSDRAELIGFVNRAGRVCMNVAQCERRSRDRGIATALLEMLPSGNSIQRLARQSKYDYMRWRDNGRVFEGRVTAENVKSAMLATGTRGHFTVWQARTGNAHSINWRLAVTYLANLNHGYYYA